MKIPTNVHKRLIKSTQFKPELQNSFVQGEHEYLTNTFYMIKMAKEPDAKETALQVPIMKIAEDGVSPSKDAPTMRLSMHHLLDVLEVLKANGSTFVDITLGTRAMQCKGLNNSFDDKQNINISALLMMVNK